MRKPLLTVILAAALATACSTTTTGTGTAPTIVYLRHTSAKDMAATLDRFLADATASGGDYPTIRCADDDDSTLLIEGSREHVSQVLMLISNLDVEKPK